MFYIGKLLILYNTSINIQVITLSLTCVYNVIKVAISNPELECSDTHIRVKNGAAEKKKKTSPISVTEPSLQQEEENHMWPGTFKKFWPYFLIPINQKYFLKHESILNVRHL